MSNLTFDEWAFEQTAIKGFSVFAVKDINGKNIKWVNRQTGDEYVLNEQPTNK